MPFGLRNAPPTFQRYMAKVLRECIGICEAYIDDIIIYSKSRDQHAQDLAKVLQALWEEGLKVNYKKCVFGKEEVEFLGHVLKDGRIWMQKGKQEAIQEWEEPLKTPKQVRQFIGLASYYRNYMRGFATIARPLIELIRKRLSIQWTWEVQQAFRQSREALNQKIGRKPWNSNLPTRVTTDASGSGLGAILEQQDEGEWRTIAVWSRTLNSCQRNYSMLDKEWLAIMEAVTHVWKHFLIGISFEIHTDHAPLCQILTSKVEELTPQQLRWLEQLQPFGYTMQYIKGGGECSRRCVE